MADRRSWKLEGTRDQAAGGEPRRVGQAGWLPAPLCTLNIIYSNLVILLLANIHFRMWRFTRWRAPA